MNIRNKIRKILEQDEAEFRSETPASDPVQGATIRDPSLQSKKERQSTRDIIFKKLMDTNAYKTKIDEIGSITDEEKLNFVKQLVQKKDILDKEPDEDYIEVLEDEIEHRQEMNNKLLQRANEAIKAYNDAVESHKNAFGAGLSTAFLTLPELRNIDDFKGLEQFLANSPHIAKRFLSLLGIDLSSLEEEPLDVGMDSRVDALSGEINSSELPPRVKQQFLRRINTIKRAISQGKEKIKTSKGPRVEVSEFFDAIVKDLQQARSKLMNEQKRGINAPNPEKAEDTINRYVQWLTSGQNYRSLPNIINSLQEMVKALKSIEINNMLIKGFSNKRQKLLNLSSNNKELSSDEIEMIVLDPDDFPVGDNEPTETLEEVKIMSESNENTKTPHENSYKRQRTITRKFKLKEIWKQQQDNILKKKVETDKEEPDTGPDLHLGDMG